MCKPMIAAFLLMISAVSAIEAAKPDETAFRSGCLTGADDSVSVPLRFAPRDSREAARGFQPLRLFALPAEAKGRMGTDEARGVFAVHAYSVEGAGPTADRSNEAVCIGWNPMGQLLAGQPGFWWQYEWGYRQADFELFELNLDVRDSLTLPADSFKRRISYKMDRSTGEGVGADFAFERITFQRGNRNAGSALQGNFLRLDLEDDIMDVAVRTHFRRPVIHQVHSFEVKGGTAGTPLSESDRIHISLVGEGSECVVSLIDAVNGGTSRIVIANLRKMPVSVRFSSADPAVKLFWNGPPQMKLEPGERALLEATVMNNEILLDSNGGFQSIK